MSNVSQSSLDGHLRRLHSLAAELDIECDLYAAQCGIDPRDTIPEVTPPRVTPAVVRGQARLALVAALADVAGAMDRLEALADAFARALDAGR